MCIIKGKRLNTLRTRRFQLYDSLEKARPWGRDGNGGGQGLGEGGTGGTRGFPGPETAYDAVMVDTCHCTFVQTHRIKAQGMSPHVNN